MQKWQLYNAKFDSKLQNLKMAIYQLILLVVGH